MRFFICFCLLLISLENKGFAQSQYLQEREKDSQRIQELSFIFAQFFEFEEGVEWKEITEQILEHPNITVKQKKRIQDSNRRIFAFIYPSDGLKVKGFMSFVPQPHEHSTLILLRGGNKLFGLLNPGGDLACVRDYTVISTLYRDGICEGVDEFGGEDVN